MQSYQQQQQQQKPGDVFKTLFLLRQLTNGLNKLERLFLAEISNLSPML